MMKKVNSLSEFLTAEHPQAPEKLNVFTDVVFQIKAETELSESVAVCGDCFSLGFWQPKDALKLTTTPATYPTWTGRVKLPVSVPVNYRYVKLGAKENNWEVLKANRSFTTTGAALYVDDGVFGVLPDASTSRIRVDFSPPSHDNKVASTSVSAPPSATTVILVLYRLPVTPHKTEQGWKFEWNDDALYFTSLGLKRGMAEKTRLLWLGWPTVYIPPEEQDQVAKTLLEEHNCIPVFLPDTGLVYEHYHGFCKEELWMAFHNVIDLSGTHSREYNRSHWQAYLTLNAMFAQTVIENYDDSAVVWIHDYHLLVLPTYLRRKHPPAKIGIFLHTPFPSSEVYRTIPVREDLLRGMLSASLVGFHLFDYARHFLSCCTRMLGLQFESRRGGFLGVEYNGRHVMVRVSHVGIDPERFLSRMEDADVIESTEVLARKFENKVVLLGIDDMDKLKGVPLKMLAMEHLLENYPCWRNKVVLYQVMLPKDARFPEQQEVRDEVNEIIARVNGRFGSPRYTPIEYSERHLTFDERVALYSIAHAVVNTSIRDGLNLVPYEFVCCSGDKGGVLIASEFTGCSRALSGVIHVNPWNKDDVAKAIDHALSMSAIERQVKHDKDFQYVTAHTTMIWADSFLADLEKAGEHADKLTYLNLGLGVGFRVLEFGPNFQKLNFDVVSKSYRDAKRRLLVFDYEGTLTPLGSLAGLSVPSAATLAILAKLCSSPKNTVFIVSGRKRDVMEGWFREVKSLGLAAEHGVFFQWDRSSSWQQLSDALDLTWMEAATEIFQSYTERTDGSFIEAKESALVWHFRDADPDFGLMQAKELHDHLDSVLSNFPVQVVDGKGIVEVKPKGINKGVMVEKLLTSMMTSDTHPVDFVLVIGDDRSDEDMFTTVDSFYSASGPGAAMNATTVSCTVGHKPSHAKYYVDNHDEVLDLLATIADARPRTVPSSRNSFSETFEPSFSETFMLGKPH